MRGDGRAWARPTHYRPLPPQGDWLGQAACAGHNPSHWYVTARIGSTYGYAREICATCPVQPECLDWALEAHEELGMWGGLTPDERRRVAQRRALQAGHAYVEEVVCLALLVLFIVVGLRLVGLSL